MGREVLEIVRKPVVAKMLPGDSGKEMLRKNREALESGYVPSDLLQRLEESR